MERNPLKSVQKYNFFRHQIFETLFFYVTETEEMTWFPQLLEAVAKEAPENGILI